MEKKKLLHLIDYTNKYKYLILFLSLFCTTHAVCPKGQAHKQTCPIQKLSIAEEEVTPTVLVFASFSMPEPTLKQLASDLKKINGALVIRGLINNSFKETALYLQKLGEGVLLDPTLFEKFNIAAVPTFIILEGDLKSEQNPVHDRLSGNVSVRFFLEKASQEGDIRAAALLLQKLKGSV